MSVRLLFVIIICDFNHSTLIRGYCLCVTESGFNLCVKSGLKQEIWENDHQQRLQYRKCVHVFALTESESEKIKEGMKEVFLETLAFLFVFLCCPLSPVSSND